MVYVKYTPHEKVIVVRLLLQNRSEESIRRILDRPVSRKSCIRWLDLYEETKRVVRDPEEYDAQGRPSFLGLEDEVFMRALVDEQPGLFLDEIREQIYDEQHVLLSPTTIHRKLVDRLNITLKRAHTSNIRKSAYLKALYMGEMEHVPSDFLVFTDESAVCDRDLLRTSARSTKGKRVTRFVINQNPKRYNILAGISLFGVEALKIKTTKVTRKTFEYFLKYDLLPRMNPYPAEKSILVLDNAPIHKGGRVERLCKDAGIRIKYLPPYCPELNPIEMCFGVFKADLRRTRILTYARHPEFKVGQSFCKVIKHRLLINLYREASYHNFPDNM